MQAQTELQDLINKQYNIKYALYLLYIHIVSKGSHKMMIKFPFTHF